MVTPDYLSTIYKAMEKKPDCIPITILRISDRLNDVYETIHQIKTKVLYMNYPGRVQHQIIGQMCPRRTVVAKKSKWPDMSYFEDGIWDLMQMHHIWTLEGILHPTYLYMQQHEVGAAVRFKAKTNNIDQYIWYALIDSGFVEHDKQYISPETLSSLISEMRANRYEHGTPIVTGKQIGRAHV